MIYSPPSTLPSLDRSVSLCHKMVLQASSRSRYPAAVVFASTSIVFSSLHTSVTHDSLIITASDTRRLRLSSLSRFVIAHHVPPMRSCGVPPAAILISISCSTICLSAQFSLSSHYCQNRTTSRPGRVYVPTPTSNDFRCYLCHLCLIHLPVNVYTWSIAIVSITSITTAGNSEVAQWIMIRPPMNIALHISSTCAVYPVSSCNVCADSRRRHNHPFKSASIPCDSTSIFPPLARYFFVSPWLPTAEF
ncbi:hypothetical protein DFH11DRAFT_1087554 [Phellopilus nigrolimitatus]|nr:hypothetical protein DFH11DRAFT_1270821 [Phellopilus nigrolimitatus]KAH8108580.1 hypothetical protein DFH11DRAFT_1087554 [Phellopilus nigrolimitatus]